MAWRVIIFTCVFLLSAGGSVMGAETPLVLQSVGSFFVGGRMVTRTAAEVGVYGGGSQAMDQMYVQYMIPQAAAKPPVVMIHGSILTGKTYETTPDGRAGWYEYFARKGYPSYVVDQVGRGRSGFDQTPFNDVQAGNAAPDSQPIFRRGSSEVIWVRLRIGPAFGRKYDDTQFPVEAAGEFSKQTVPDLTSSFPKDDPNYPALSELALKLGGAVLIGHSQAGRYPFEAALLNPKGIRALVAIEPAGCKSDSYSDEEIAKLAKLPILIVFGDHLDTPQSFGASWLTAFTDCRAFVTRVNAVKGKVTMLHLPEAGIHGNTHMLMQDRNNLQIADMIMQWIDLHTS
jgi:pimeloyl-ACP methyl ester carboxylesterase